MRRKSGVMPPYKEPTEEQKNWSLVQLQSYDGLPLEDFNLPKSMVTRLAKGVLSPNTILQKDAMLAFMKGATVFVNYLANSANDHAVLAGKKTIQPQDVLAALKELEFEAFLPRCEAELERYNTIQCDKRNAYRRRVREEAIAEAQAAQEEGDTLGASSLNQNGGLEGEASTTATHSSSNGFGKKSTDGPSSAKRARMSDGTANLEDGDDTEEAEFEDAQEEQDEDEEEDEDEDEEDADEDIGEDGEAEEADHLDDGPATQHGQDDEDGDGSDSD